jgi:hypothetical protein
MMMSESVARNAYTRSADVREVLVVMMVPVRHERADLLGRNHGWEGREYMTVSPACRPEGSCRGRVLHGHHLFTDLYS